MLGPLHSTEEAVQGMKGGLAELLFDAAMLLRKLLDPAVFCFLKVAAETHNFFKKIIIQDY